jgi:hypothetical protein
MATQMCLERFYISFHLGEVVGGAMICHALLQQQHQIIKLSLQVGTCSLNRKQRHIYIYM